MLEDGCVGIGCVGIGCVEGGCVEGGCVGKWMCWEVDAVNVHDSMITAKATNLIYD